jgi:hypothetical protein
MVLTLTTTHTTATGLGSLLAMLPAGLQGLPPFLGTARVAYSEASQARRSAALPLDVGRVALSRGRKDSGGPLLGTREFIAMHEPLRRVHECVFGMRALESEAVDPRL